jgi:hypothetical protein
VIDSVPIAKAAELTGYTEKAIERKIEEGIWLEGELWRYAPDGKRHIILKGYNAWAAKGTGSKRGPRRSASSSS